MVYANHKKPIKPYSAVLVTSYCTLCIIKREEQREVSGATHRLLCTWTLLCLAEIGHGWHHNYGPTYALAAWTGLENTTITL